LTAQHGPLLLRKQLSAGPWGLARGGLPPTIGVNVGGLVCEIVIARRLPLLEPPSTCDQEACALEGGVHDGVGGGGGVNAHEVRPHAAATSIDGVVVVGQKRVRLHRPSEFPLPSPTKAALRKAAHKKRKVAAAAAAAATVAAAAAPVFAVA
jgi:hypothetical protein